MSSARPPLRPVQGIRQATQCARRGGGVEERAGYQRTGGRGRPRRPSRFQRGRGDDGGSPVALGPWHAGQRLVSPLPAFQLVPLAAPSLASHAW